MKNTDEILSKARKIMESNTTQQIINNIKTKAIMLHKTKTIKEYIDITNNKRSTVMKDVIDENEKYNATLFKQNTGHNSQHTIARAFPVKIESNNELISAMLITKYHISTKAIKPNDSPRRWTASSTIIIFKNKDIVNAYYNTSTDSYEYSIPARRTKVNYAFDFTRYNMPNFTEVRETLQEIWGRTIFNIGGTHYVEIENNWQLNEMILIKNQKTTGKSQYKINMLNSKLTPISDLKEKLDKADHHTKNLAIIDDINEKNTICIRMFTKKNIIKECTLDNLHEDVRLYIDNKKITCCKENADGDWIRCMMNSNSGNWYYILASLDISPNKTTKLNYIIPILEKTPEEYRIYMAILLISYPAIENYCKLYGSDDIINICKQRYNSGINAIEMKYGKCNRTAKSFTKFIGFNKQQWDIIRPELNKTENLCAFIKNIWGVKDISDLDIETFKSIINIHNTLSQYYTSKYSGFKFAIASPYQIQGIIKKISNYGNAAICDSKDYIKCIADIIKNQENNTEDRRDTTNLLYNYYDYLDIISKMPNNKSFSWKFDKDDPIESINRLHDDALYVYNIQRDVFEKESFIKATNRIKKYEFEDDDYIAISPKEPNDLINESLKLHHCVKIYIDRIIENRTNIMMIRKKSDINTPFFTVEITNKGVIEQIHGLKNRNLNTEPDLIPFVEKWKKAKLLKTNNLNKIR